MTRSTRPVPQPDAARLAEPGERALAAELIHQGSGGRPEQSGAEVHYVVWPACGEIRTATAVVVYCDGTAFAWLPTGDRTPAALCASYAGLRRLTPTVGVRTLLTVLPPAANLFEPELIEHGFRLVSTVLRMECAKKPDATDPFQIEEAPLDERLSRLVGRTYVGSLSDPALQPDRPGSELIERVLGEPADEHRAFLHQFGTTDIGVCLLNGDKDLSEIAIRYLGVVPEHRGRGIGLAILRQSLRQVWTSDYTRAAVDVDEQNTYALDIYRQLGFRRISESREFVLELNDY